MSRSFFFPNFARRTAIAAMACVASVTFAVSTAHAQGLFAAPTSTPSSLPSGVTPQGVAAADFALSGFQGLAVVTNSDTSLNVYLGTGNGTFAAGAQSVTCSGPSAVLAEDVNNDGYPDIIVACPGSNTVDLFLNNGSGGPGTFPLYPSDTYTVADPVAMVGGDFLGNGYKGAAFASGTGGVTVYQGSVSGPITTTVSVPGTLSGIAAGALTLDTTYGTGATPTAIAPGDFNNDGIPNMAIAYASGVTVLLGNSNGGLTSGGGVTVGTTLSAIAAGNFHGVKNTDLAVTDSTANRVYILIGAGNGTFIQSNSYAAFQTVLNPALFGTPYGIAALDANRDGKPDVVVTQGAAASGSIATNKTIRC